MKLVPVLASWLMLTAMLSTIVLPAPTVGDWDKNRVYVLEMPVIVDGLGVAKWKEVTGTNNEFEIYAEIKSFLRESAQMFTSLDRWGDDLNIRLDVSVHLYHRNLLSSDKIHGQKALDQFQEWLETDFKGDYDIAMLYTGSDLLGYRNRSSTNGYANMGSVCTKSSLVVLEVSGGYTDAIIMTHEAGHVMGAYHDGQKGARECSAKPIATTIMGPSVSGKSPHQYYFSNCSYHSILNKNKQCIRGQCVQTDEGSPYITDSCPLGDQPILENNRTCSDLSPKECYTYGIQCCQTCDGNTQFPKTNMTTHKACQDLGGSHDWEFVQSHDGGHDMCARLPCTNTQTEEPVNKTFTAPNGLPCAKDKRCYEGRCIGSKN